MSSMVRFMFLFRGGAVVNSSLSDEQRQAQIGKWGAWTSALKTNGHLLAGGYPLQAASQLIRGADVPPGDPQAPNGAELVTGNLVVQAGSLEHALLLARGCPILDVNGSVEVRQILERPL